METDWVIPDLRNTRLSDTNPIALDHEVTTDQLGAWEFLSMVIIL